jgi:hypothetical protein
MYKYPKIETVYKRDMEGTKQLIEGDFRDKTVEMLANSPIWDCYEKLDGSNHQIFWDGHSLTFGGRTENSNIPKHIQAYFDEKFNNNETEELFEQLFADKPMVLYFEAIGEKIQTYGAKYGDVRFVLLDVYNVTNDSWWSIEGILSVAKALSVQCKPLLLENVTLDVAIEFVKDTPFSEIAKSPLPIEGLVCVPRNEIKDANGNRVILKIKGCDFCQDWRQLMEKYKNENS